MKIQSVIASCVFTFSALALSANALAKSVSIYEQPETTAKVVGTIDLSAGVIPIFTPKGSDWVKVGDPHNGNVGWIKGSDLTSGNTSSFSFTQKVISDGKEPQSYKIEFGNMPSVTAKQAEDFIKAMQMQQTNIQQNAQKVMEDLMHNIKLQKENGTVIMPIVIIPSSALKPADIKK